MKDLSTILQALRSSQPLAPAAPPMASAAPMPLDPAARGMMQMEGAGRVPTPNPAARGMMQMDSAPSMRLEPGAETEGMTLETVAPSPPRVPMDKIAQILRRDNVNLRQN